MVQSHPRMEDNYVNKPISPGARAEGFNLILR